MSYNLHPTPAETMSDMPFREYNRRQLHEISPESIKDRALQVKPAGNFNYEPDKWLPNEYEGFAVVSMLNENEGNEPLMKRLIEIQEELKYNLQPQYGFYQLPAESFHQTVANTLSAERFRKNILDAGLEDKYPSIIEKAFDHIHAPQDIEPIKMTMAGLSIFGTAIGILGTFKKEDDYKRITNFREAFYADRQLAMLDVKMTRPFIGHITLSYIEHTPNKNQKEHLAAVINEINEALQNEDNYFMIANTALKRYHHLAEFIKLENYPSFLL
jgi:hypothetical protein